MKLTHPIAPIAFLAASLAAPMVSAQAINLSSGFMPDPQRYPGQSGGPVVASTVQSDCRGFIPAQPSFILTTATGFRFLRVFAESGQDTTLMIRGVSRTWCADDTYGQNPGVDLRGLPPGRYDIYVGSYAQGTVAPYQLGITELANVAPGRSQIQPNIPTPQGGGGGSLGNLDPSLRPAGRPINVPAVPRRPIAVMGRTDGVFDASSGTRGDGTCRGWMQAAPSHLMMVRAPQSFLSVFVLSAADTTLVIRRPDGSIVCNDDRYQLNPGIQGTFPDGLYQVWVGTYRQGENRPYRITVTSDPSQHP
jgi:hypothetical protein